MRLLKLRSIFFIFFLSVFSFSFGQNAKSLVKDAKKDMKEANFSSALTRLDQAINQEPGYLDAIVLRAEINEKTGHFLLAAEDYKKASNLDQKSEEFAYHAGRLFNYVERYNDALPMLERALMIDHKHLGSLQEKVSALIAQERFNEAIVVAEKALYIKKTDLNYYNHGIASIGIGNLEIAANDFEKSIKENDQFEKAYLALAEIQLKLGKVQDAIKTINDVIRLNPSNRESYIVRSKIHVAMDNYLSAINDLSYILANISPDDPEVLILRGKYYHEISQFENAIRDFTTLINMDGKNELAYFNRAKAYEETTEFDLAVSDYENFRKLTEDNSENTQRLLAHAKERIYELNRETRKPVFELISPKVKNNDVIEVRLDAKTIRLTGLVRDDSEIRSFLLNGVEQEFLKDTKYNDFNIDLPTENLNQVELVFIDIYDNRTEATYTIQKTEIDPPTIHLSNPQASDNGEIWLQTDSDELYLQGVITDESRIKSIYINEVTASYNAEENNPSFSATINIVNKKNILITVTDIYGNITKKQFTFNKSGVEEFADNPMGKTWVIFIENTDYQSFTRLEGPANDIALMKGTLASYDIHNIIHKKNMIKSDMERFFAIELRDMVRENNVNSIMIWYAGHGKFINETGYWIPINAKPEDEFTYFNINNLRASMQSYAKYLTHTLIITDACESGPSFYMAMRSEPEERDCKDWNATKFKSSQVFTSAGNEMASDNSQFTRTFAKALQYNPDDCIAIDNIVIKVTKVVSQNGVQKPKFGKIAGLEDENGTFFFIKK